MANRTKDAEFDWDAVDWRAREQDVRRLRQRIFKATREQDWANVRNLQRLMLRSWSNTLISVRQVTQLNAGRKTPGVDERLALTSPDRARLATRMHRDADSWTPLPVKRVYIPKARGRLRPLGIPVITDRCHQARVRNALEPEWEARFEARSYGFRPGRSCQDAIQMLFSTLGGRTPARQWIIDADLSAAFDTIDHDRLLATLGNFPARDLIAAWLKAGVFETGKGYTPTTEGTPQGGVISPLLMNVALHGLEEAAGVRHRHEPSQRGKTALDSPVLVRYADDFVVCCHSRQQAEQITTRLARWLAPRGLTLNEDKTRITHLSAGFDFLGFNIRRYTSGKTLTKPSNAAIKRIRKRLTIETRNMRGWNAGALIARLNPIIRGWAAYYRGAVAAETFKALDSHVWRLTYKWACRSHPTKSKRWIINRYFGAHNRSNNDRWVFGDRDSGAYLVKFAWTPIVRHIMVSGAASPDDPDLTGYWASRRRRVKPPLDGPTLHLLTKQDARCPLCGHHLLSPDQPPQSPLQWERWWLHTVRRAIAADYLVHHPGHRPPDDNRIRLVHASCYAGHHNRQRRNQAQPHSPAPPSRLA